MEFLYPTSRQFPFDEVSERIVRELKKRNWQVPGVEVEFHEYGTGAQKFRNVSCIKSKEFKLRFGRVQRRLPDGRFNDIAAVTGINIPKKEICVYEDESGPTFYLYVGDDYERDRENFMNGWKVNSKLRGEPKMYLQYDGRCDCRTTSGAAFEAVGFLTALIDGDAKALTRMNHTHTHRRSPLLVHTNDLEREYDPEGNEPKFFQTYLVMEEFRDYLRNVVLKMVVSNPIPAEKIDRFASPAPIPFPESIGSIFCFAEYRDVERIKLGKTNVRMLNRADQYALQGSGYRLASLDVLNDGTVPKIAYDGFLWCGIGEVTAETKIESLEVPGHHRWSDREQFVIRLKPNCANDIYIADHGEYDKRRTWLTGVCIMAGRKEFTNAEVSDFNCARARTIIPISKYQGGFEKPVVLIKRELSFDEVEVVSGPHKSSFNL